MKKWEVNVCRTGYGFRTISVRAKNWEEAEKKAFEQAGNYEYSEKSSEYTTDGITQVKDDGKEDSDD